MSVFKTRVFAHLRCPKWLGEDAKGVLVHVDQKPVALEQERVALVQNRVVLVQDTLGRPPLQLVKTPFAPSPTTSGTFEVSDACSRHSGPQAKSTFMQLMGVCMEKGGAAPVSHWYNGWIWTSENDKRPESRGFKKSAEIGHGSSAPLSLHRNTLKHVFWSFRAPQERSYRTLITSWTLDFRVFCCFLRRISPKFFCPKLFCAPWGRGRPRFRVMDVRTQNACIACYSKVSRACPKFLTQNVRTNDPGTSAGYPAQKLSVGVCFFVLEMELFELGLIQYSWACGV